jgi:hypothetical protein
LLYLGWQNCHLAICCLIFASMVFNDFQFCTQQAGVERIKSDEYILSPDEIRAFHEYGYVVVRQILTPEEMDGGCLGASLPG